MKRLICVLLVMIVILTISVSAATPKAQMQKVPTIAISSVYALAAKVVELDKAQDIVTAMDGNGNLWQFYHCEDWFINDCVILIMDNNGTSIIYDDIILKTLYSNWELHPID